MPVATDCTEAGNMEGRMSGVKGVIWRRVVAVVVVVEAVVMAGWMKQQMVGQGDRRAWATGLWN